MIHLKKKKLFLCENLDIGINGTHILNKKTQTQCQIKKPEGYCYMDYFKYYFIYIILFFILSNNRILLLSS